MPIKYKQIGTIGTRDPVTREFINSTPVYIQEDSEDIKARQAEDSFHREIGRVFAQKMKQYIDSEGNLTNKKQRAKYTVSVEVQTTKGKVFVPIEEMTNLKLAQLQLEALEDRNPNMTFTIQSAV